MNKSESIKELATALSKAQTEISNPKKNAANPFFKSRYSDLSEVINVSKPILSEHGLSILQMPMFSDNLVSVETVLLHDSGEYISNTISMPISKADPQSIGSLISYCRRYSWASVCGLAQEDDDGNAASGKTEKETKAKSEVNPLQPKIDELKRLASDEPVDIDCIREAWRSLDSHKQQVVWKMLSTKEHAAIRHATQGAAA